MQFCNEQIRTQPLFSPPCASATYGSARMCRRKSWNILKAKILYSLSKCKSCRLSINNCVVLSMLVAEIKWKQMNFTCQNKLVFVFLSCILVSNYVHSRHSRLIAFPYLLFCVCLHPLSHSIWGAGRRRKRREAGWYQATVIHVHVVTSFPVHENEWWISPMMNYKQ